MDYFYSIFENFMFKLSDPLNFNSEIKLVNNYNSMIISIKAAQGHIINWKNVKIISQKSLILIKYDFFIKKIRLPVEYSHNEILAKLVNNGILIIIPNYKESKLIIVEGIN